MGACWAFVRERSTVLHVRPAIRSDERWRVDLFLVLLAVWHLVWLLILPRAVHAVSGAIYFFLVHADRVVHPAARLGAHRLDARGDTALWGGLLVTMVVAVVGIAVSLPLGIVLALGRRSNMPAIQLFSVALHRIRARRAADHGAVHGQRDAAAVPAGQAEHRTSCCGR